MSKEFLKSSGIFFDADDGMPEMTINLNDTFYWACADCETIPENEIEEVARLMRTYGWCGVLYWVARRRGWDSVEFEDVNRHIEFVHNEEEIRRAVPDCSRRAYHKAAYTIGLNIS